jgi:hypothetical protein
LNWRDAEEKHDEFLCFFGVLCTQWIEESMGVELPAVHIEFRYSDLSQIEQNIGFLNSQPTMRKGVVTIDKLIHKGIENEEHLVITVIAEDGTLVDERILERIMELEATVVGECSPETTELIAQRKAGIQRQKDEIAERNKQCFLAQEAQMEAYTEDLKDGLQKYLKATKKEIAEKKKARRALKDHGTLDEMLALSTEISKLESALKKKQREMYDEEDRLERERDAFLESVRERLNGEIIEEPIMTFSFEIV